ncbi:MAG: hypothetical protein QG652_682 [Pseudomonadota bacterium]|nr:hypothetical protein [Pseudomonadota bacterium]
MNNINIRFRKILTMWSTRTATRRDKSASKRANAFISEPLIKSGRVDKRSAPTRIIVGCATLIRPTFIFNQSFLSVYLRLFADFLLKLSRAWPTPAKIALPSAGLAVAVLAFSTFNIHAQTMSYEQMLQQVVDNYPSLQTTAIAVERARLESVRVESQLGWQLNAAAGVQHDMSATFGTPTDTINLNGNVSRMLESGDTLGFVGNINRVDADSSFPGSPNPALSTHVGANYRMPLQKGADNTSLVQNRLQAEVAVAQANADRRNVYDQIASQLIDLYNNAAATRARIENTRQAIQRSQRLLKYNEDRALLGIAEDKDLLQVRAQLRSREAELTGLEMQWQAQRINLNRLMGRDANADLLIVVNVQTESGNGVNRIADELLQQATQYSPAISAVQVRLKQADTAIELSRDKR